jgi:hypothetical protein
VNDVVQQIVPAIAKQFQEALLLQQQSGFVSIYRGGVRIVGMLPTKAEDLELHTR